ncbi:MAG TPA: GMC family oxidoreductase N-terminal domain-containing protein [Longimicrobiales bacterium]|nr:GMC family oxidoreductase N-terminal domain-containing protein [Longimicrobiales bacterium]
MVLELGPWIERGPSHRAWSVCWNDRAGYSQEPGYRVEGESRKQIGGFHCVGGTSLFYGGVALRMRERDFGGYDSVAPGISWPFDYEQLAPHYDEAERLLDVRGDDRPDATAPPRGHTVPRPAHDMSPTSRALKAAALRLGLNPFRIPLGIDRERGPCEGCCACDGFVCDRKNDLAAAVLPRLQAAGLELRPNTVVRRLFTKGAHVVAVEAVDRISGERLRFEADRFVVAAGALATPQLLLASGLNHRSPARPHRGAALGRCATIHAGRRPP